MTKIHAPLGYTFMNGTKDYIDSDNREDLLAGVLSLADWDDDMTDRMEDLTNDELVRMLLDNGFEAES